MDYLRRLRKKYSHLSDAEFERFLRFASANQFHRIPVVYREGFKMASHLFQQPSVSVGIFKQDVPHLFGKPTPEESRSADLAFQIAQREQQQQYAQQVAQQVQQAEQEGWSKINPLVRFGIGLWDIAAPIFRATGTIGAALLHTGLAFSPYVLAPESRVHRLKAAYYTLGQMFTDMFDPNAPLLDPEDYYTLGLAKAVDPNIQDKIRSGKQNPYFDVIKATVVKKDGKVEERWIAPYEETYLRSDPEVAYVQLDEKTRKPNTDRIQIFGREFNKHYLIGFAGSAILDPSNFATLGSGIGVKALTRPIAALDDAIRILKQSPIKGLIGIGVDIAATPYILPPLVVGRALGFGVRRLPSIVEKATQSPILQHPVVRTIDNALDNLSSIFLPYFYNLENRGVRPSTILTMMRPLFDMSKEGRTEFIKSAPEKVRQVMAEWGSEGTDFSDESWEFIKTILGVKDDIPLGKRKEWLAQTGKIQELAEKTTLWSNPHPVISNFAQYWEKWKPAAQIWKAGLHLKRLFEGFGYRSQSDIRRVIYPIVRLWDENQATMEEVGRQVRQAQQAIIDKQGDTAIAFTKALTGNPEFEQTDLGKAIREFQEAEAELATGRDIRGRLRTELIRVLSEALDKAGIAITDEGSALRLLDLVGRALYSDEFKEQLSRTISSPEEAHKYLRSLGIITSSPEHSFDVVKLMRTNRRILRELMRYSSLQEEPFQNAVRRFSRSIIELRRHGLTPEIASGLENIYYTMRTVYDTMNSEQRRQFQSEFGRLMTALMTGQVFDPRELRRFYQWMDENNISATVKETVQSILEHTANKSTLEPFITAQTKRMRAGMSYLLRELLRQNKIEAIGSRVKSAASDLQRENPCL